MRRRSASAESTARSRLAWRASTRARSWLSLGPSSARAIAPWAAAMPLTAQAAATHRTAPTTQARRASGRVSMTRYPRVSLTTRAGLPSPGIQYHSGAVSSPTAVVHRVTATTNQTTPTGNSTTR
jgi:hypothetical protein